MTSPVTFRAELSGFKKAIAAKSRSFVEAARPASQAMAQVFYEQMRTNAFRLGTRTGKLADSIYQAYSADNSLPGGNQTYHISWNARKAPHGHLIEYGWVQRYKVYVGSDGQWHTAVRRSSRGAKPPRRNASQSQKDAYYVSLPSPRHHPGHAFARSAVAAAPRALQAANVVLARALNGTVA